MRSINYKQIFCLVFFSIIGCFIYMINGCSTDKPPEKKTIIETLPYQRLPIHIQVAPHVNGANSPLYIVVYQLRASLPFTEMNFEAFNSLTYKELANAYITSTEYYLIPEQSKTIDLPLNPDTQYIGIFANYKKSHSVNWRVLVSLNSLEENKQLSLSFTPEGVYLKKLVWPKKINENK